MQQTEIEFLRELEEGLREEACTFWACSGPDEPPEDMATCDICQMTQAIMKRIK